MSFTYKGDLRASKTVDGVTHYYYYSGNNIVSEVWGNKSLTFLYDESGVYGFIYDDGTTETLYYYLKNLQGDVICLLDETLQPVVYYHYNAYGELIELYEIVDGTWDEISLRTVTDHIAFINPLRYRSYYYDNDLKLYYLTTRYYDCVTGRFINADGLVSTGQSTTGFNMFAYCNNKPISYVDIYGSMPTIFSNNWVMSGPIKVSASPKNASPIKINPYVYTKSKDEEVINPVEGGTIQYNDYPTYAGSTEPHRGTDILGAYGANVYSIGVGTVIEVNTKISYNTYKNDEINDVEWNSYGIFVRVQYDNIIVVYAHLSGVAVEEGQNVLPWDIIGYLGNTGNSSGAHLHFEVNDPNDRSRVLDPYSYLP